MVRTDEGIAGRSEASSPQCMQPTVCKLYALERKSVFSKHNHRET